MPRRSRNSSACASVELSPGQGNGEDKCLDTDTPALDILYGYTSGVISASVLKTGHELEIFDALEERGGPWSAEKLAKAKGFHAESTERLLNALTAMKLLVKEKKASSSVYKNSDVGKLLVKNNPNNLREMVSWMDLFTDALKTLPDIVKSGPEFFNQFEEGFGEEPGKTEMTDKEKGQGESSKSTEDMEKCHHGNLHDKDGNVYDEAGNKVHGPGKDEHEEADCGDCGDTTDHYEGLHNLLGASSARLMAAIDLSGYKSAVDLGGGSGILCMELRRQYPEMDVTLFEKKNIVQIFKEKYLPGHEHLKIKTIEGDWNKTPLPKADLYVISQVVHEIDNADEVLRKVYSAISPGGAILIMENTLADDKASLMQPAIWDLVMATHGSRLRSPAEFRSWLTGIGFQNVLAIRTQPNNEYDMIYAKKPEHSDNKKSKK